MTMGRNVVMGCGGCGSAFVGAVGAVVLWATSERTQVHLGGAFESNGMDLSVLWKELPLVALAGAALPTLVWALAARVLNRRAARRAAEDERAS
ncbi:hypothetical protein [Streptomyces boluensis]|uniref:hypothetical protein n=1 Tax=Streptomyces boluensis TaxID=1775135 RepID=UPI0016525CE8|nr:hypothetical protein [Streptomyces boluensis]